MVTKQLKENLSSIIERIEEDAEVTGKAQYNEAALWNTLDMVTQIITVIFPAIVFFLATKDYEFLNLSGIKLNPKDVIAFLALISAIISGLKLSLNFSGRTKMHNDTGAELLNLRDDAYNFAKADLYREDISEEELLNKVNNLNERRSTLRKNLTQHSERSYKKSKEGIEKGESFYKADNKISAGTSN